MIYNRDGIVRTEAQMKRSYNSYLKYRQKWKEKGYKQDEKLTIEEYTKWHFAQTLANTNAEALGLPHDPNIARTIAREELSYTATSARALAKKAQKMRSKSPRPSKEYDIYDLAEWVEEEQMSERERVLEKYSNWRNIVEAEDREAVFKELAAAEIDMDMWKYDDDTRDRLYHDDLKRFRERFEADLYRV